MLMSEYDKRACKRAVYTEIRNLWHDNRSLQYLEAYHHEEHLNFLINLDRSEDQVWKLIHGARRKNIRRAYERGLSVEEVSNRSLIPVFYGILKETYREVGIPLADISLFEAGFEIFCSKNLAKFFLARLGDRYVGARAVLLFRGEIYDWYAGADRRYLQHYPNDILVWHILKWGANNGYRVFDFGGAGKPDVEYGPREFKRRFGGELVNFGREALVYKRPEMILAEAGLKAYKSLGKAQFLRLIRHGQISAMGSDRDG
jgi:lipid II:glycine glycyltransferase (peptidoglycan interpeptide bridge formation enzyme)